MRPEHSHITVIPAGITGIQAHGCHPWLLDRRKRRKFLLTCRTFAILRSRPWRMTTSMFSEARGHVKANQRHQSGVTLIELILSMVIISIALVGIFSVINLTVIQSADPIVQYQAIAIAEAYLEEIQLQSYNDPNGTNVGETRSSFDNVADYNGLNDVGAHNQQGALLTNLSAYNVSVAIVDQTVTGLTVKKITVTVSSPSTPSLSLVGYRFNY